MWIKQSEVLRASQTGLFSAAVKKGRARHEGREDRHHHRLPRQGIEEIRATFDGQILYVIGTPPISKGEPVAMLGR